MSVLLTGGTGYIGSHVAAALIAAGGEAVLADNFSNSGRDVPERIARITGRKPKTYDADICDASALERIFAENDLSAVIHLAGFKAVAESVAKPLAYYRNNLDGLLTLLETMRRYDCHCIAFSSSATVYGTSNPSPITEEAPTGGCTNPYGWSKYMAERILMDAAKADPDLSVILLRYFNPVGAHPSGLIGERPSGTPNNLMPCVTEAALGKRERLSIYGADYPTPDGTGIRDYIHVMDLAEGHLAALDYGAKRRGVEIFNLGRGEGVSVLELVETFQRVNGVKVPYVIEPRRAGDIAVCYADAGKAERTLHWTAKRTLEEMCRDAWNWERQCAGG